MICVRFAPSPTGFLHIGGARTALFNWLFARHQKGKFILRIEDTDLVRSEKRYLDEILESLKWLGLDWDEIYFQSQRFDIYREYAQKLLKEGKAYEEKPAIIFKVQPRKIKIDDIVHGAIEFDSENIKDQVLIKSDNSPAYNFACVIDDALLGISHIIRGDDHISNTPKQIMLYEALGFALPKFAHIPLILGTDRSRLSKRHGATSLSEYKNQGYLKEALVNYIALLGWSPGDNREILSLKEMVECFSLKRVGETGAVFDIEKLNWVNAEYIRRLSPDIFLDYVRGLLTPEENAIFANEYLSKILTLIQPRITKLNREELLWHIGFYLNDNIEPDEKAKKILEKEGVKERLAAVIEKFKQIDDFNIVSTEEAIRSLATKMQLKAADFIHPIRASVTGKTIGAGLFEILNVLGKEKVIQRLNKFL